MYVPKDIFSNFNNYSNNAFISKLSTVQNLKEQYAKEAGWILLSRGLFKMSAKQSLVLSYDTTNEADWNITHNELKVNM